MRRASLITALVLLLAAPAWGSVATEREAMEQHAWRVALVLSGLPPEEQLGLVRPPTIFSAPQYTIEDGALVRVCGEVQRLYVRSSDGEKFHVNEMLMVFVYTAPEEHEVRFNTLIHEYLHITYFHIARTHDLPRELGELWVNAHINAVCPPW